LHYKVARPTIFFTDEPFPHSRTMLAGADSSSNDCTPANCLSSPYDFTPIPAAMCRIADATQGHEVLINGLRRGVSPKHRENAKLRCVWRANRCGRDCKTKTWADKLVQRPLLSKVSLFALFHKAIDMPLPAFVSTLLRGFMLTLWRPPVTCRILSPRNAPLHTVARRMLSLVQAVHFPAGFVAAQSGRVLMYMA
jgi:hypothetical protein